jgi:heme-degrading monooxygenase HmoA
LSRKLNKNVRHLTSWKDLESIKKWKDNAEHIIARISGREIWYKSFKTRIAKVELDNDFHNL